MDEDTLKKLENEAMITGEIPRRSSIARTPEMERKRKQSAPAILKSPEKETLINKPEETYLSKKFKKQDGPAQEKQARVDTNYSDKEKETRGDDKSKRWLNNIKEAKEKIIKATTRYSSGKLSFNKEEQTQVRENMDLIMDVVVEMAYELGRTERQQQEQNFARKLDEQTKEIQALQSIANDTKEEIKKLRTRQPAATEAQLEIQKKQYTDKRRPEKLTGTGPINHKLTRTDKQRTTRKKSGQKVSKEKEQEQRCELTLKRYKRTRQITKGGRPQSTSPN